MKNLIFSIVVSIFIFSQKSQVKTAADIYLELEKLNVLGSVLYIAAHPDDENTAAISYYSKARHYRTAYLSMTRGDGGQNLIGPEKGTAMGIIRTEELLQARSVDGGKQYFTRAIDFGYSKSPQETMHIWNKDEILSDVVWAIRKFRPDVIITRFSPSRGRTHGHHTASAQLAVEAFHAAANPKKFTEQLKHTEIWQAKRIVWDSWRFRRGSGPEANPSSAVKENIGKYNSLLGQSYTEVSAISRTKHKSQGFGALGKRGDRFSYYEHLAGEQAKKSLFEDINTSWARITSKNSIEKKINNIIKDYNIKKPYQSVKKLVSAYKEIEKLEKNIYRTNKLNDIKQIIRYALGLWFDAISDTYFTSQGETLQFKINAINRSELTLKLKSIQLPYLKNVIPIKKQLTENENFSESYRLKIPNDVKISQPYWVEEEPLFGRFIVRDRKQIGLARKVPELSVKANFEINGFLFDLKVPIYYRWVDRVDGELYRPVEIRPAVMLQSEDPLLIFPDEREKKLRVKVKSSKDNLKGIVKLVTNKDWNVQPKYVEFNLQNKNDEKVVNFTIKPPINASESKLTVTAKIGSKSYNRGFVDIHYPHIGHNAYFPKSVIELRKIQTKKVIHNIAYIMGSGDNIPEVLRVLGYNVQLLNDNDLEQSDLSKFDVIIAGVRAYNTRDRLKYSQTRLMDYVQNGGHYLVQYNVSYGLKFKEIGPYPFQISRDRITDETAKLNLLKPDHIVFNYPNKITNSDFSNWVQERGLYFANPWDKKYQVLLAGNDKDESEKKGSVLFVKYGKGTFIYTGLSMFRELPAGVSGAIRLFVNMISVGAKNEKE